MIKKISKIHTFGKFTDYNWDTTVRDKGKNIVEFNKLNIIYGRNYSGKTTLSRIFRCFEKGILHDKYPTSKFEIIHTEDGPLDEQKLTNHSFYIRVYNEDFVKDNLKWLIDEQGHIEPFAIIGEQNVEIENLIKEREGLLGSEESGKGLRHEYKLKRKEYERKSKEKRDFQNALEDRLRTKANHNIKSNPIYNRVTYNINSIKEDIDFLDKNPRIPIDNENIISLKGFLKEESLPKIFPLAVVSPRFPKIFESSKELLDRVIKPTVPIRDLLNDAELELWVRSGIDHHRYKRETCGFCGQELPDDLWNRLDAHFSEESEELRKAIDRQMVSIEQEKEELNDLLSCKKDQFYSTIKRQFEQKEEEWKKDIIKYSNNLDKVSAELKTRLKDVFKIRIIKEIEDNSATLEALQKDFNTLIEQNNNKTDTLKNDQEKARIDLRLNEVGEFIMAIDYYGQLKKLNKLKGEESDLLEAQKKIADQIDIIEKDINRLKIEMKDEKKGADKVNHYLNHYFGHEGLRLVAQEEEAGYKFNIQRGDEIAHNLSQGERSLVAFCYFMARLEDTESEGKELIIWIDDPVSSLDNNHIFFVFSLIENIITKPIKLEDGSNWYKYRQLFISTHNLEFLKYLKQLSHPKDGIAYFLVEGSKKNSRLRLMPAYLERYITEFIYLFHQIYKCATIETPEDEHDCFYNFPNNLRKFLEAYLFYKYPNVKNQQRDRLLTFFGDDTVSFDLTNRVDNEYSHLQSIFDRSMKPIDIPEIPKLANYILNKIKEKDKDQYEALLESIKVI